MTKYKAETLKAMEEGKGIARERRWLKTSNSQYEKDLADLTKLQEMGRIKASLDLEEVARQLPAWRLEELEKQGQKK